jgi:hypothetical protein
MAHAGQEIGLGGMRLLGRLRPLFSPCLRLVKDVGLAVRPFAQESP